MKTADAAEPSSAVTSGHGFGTLPVFLAAISTILGAILFLRFGYAVGNAGLLGALAIILIGHLVTVPTALAIAEIATNRRVEGGGEYFIISRSFGTSIGGAIGVSLYLSQAVSVAFYMIAFAEAFRPLGPLLEAHTVIPFDPRYVSVTGVLLLIALFYYRGASIGVKALVVVVATMGVALLLFFLGKPLPGVNEANVGLWAKVPDAAPFFVVFAICFPAFTGMTAGVGLSGDLANPRRSIPLGTILGTFTGMIVYVAVVVKLALCASPEDLAGNQFIMADIALWGPIIPIGLACASLSSAVGSIMVAPRTLQALGGDGSLPGSRANGWLAEGAGAVNEPRNATLVTGFIALVVVALGSVDVVARLISMFFMVTYGSLCAISFLENFASRPSYRPSFRSRWYISLFGAAMCLLIMFQMDPVFAVISLLVMAGLYRFMTLRGGGEKNDLAEMFEGVMTQLTRHMHVKLQFRLERSTRREWRPSVIMVDDRTFDRKSPMDFLRWICHRHGFGTYLHFIRGRLDAATFRESRKVKRRLIQMARIQNSPVYVNTIVSPSITSALAQSLQVPGISGINNNTALFEFSTHDPHTVIDEVVDQCRYAAVAHMTLLVLRHGDFHFGEHRSIHLWLTWNDQMNANTMVLLSYILLGHPEWKDSTIRVFAALPHDQVDRRREEFHRLIAEGRLPVSEKNIRFLSVDSEEAFRSLVAKLSTDADLTVVGFDLEGLAERGAAVFTNHPTLRDVLFVHAPQEISIE